MYPVRLETERTILRDFVAEDLEACLGIVGDPAVTHHLSFDTRTREQQEAALARDVDRARGENRPDYYLAVIEKKTDQLIGFVRIGLGAHRSGELGYALRRDRWGRGYASEASAAMIDFGFGELELHRIQAACGPDNEASIRLLERLGFTREGRIRDHVFTNKVWRDSLLYSVLETEWPTSRRTT